MPFKMTKTKAGKYKVSSPNRVLAKGTTKKKAEAQLRLLNAIEYGGLKPRKRRKKPVR